MKGVTRQKVIDLCRANGIPVFKKNYSLCEAYGADEAFLTGTFGAQTPVAEIDGKPSERATGRRPDASATSTRRLWSKTPDPHDGRGQRTRTAASGWIRCLTSS